MKIRNYLTIALVSVSLFSADVSMAAFPLKKEVSKTAPVSQPANTEDVAAAKVTSNDESTTATVASESKAVRKHSLFSRILSTITKGKEAPISQIGYIILSIFALGWLAMGINDSFHGFDWVLSLILYIIFYLPGLIYSIVMMSKYY